MSDISSWLEALDLGKYADVFIEQEIDFNMLPQLTEEDIRELGLPLGPRRKLLTALQALKSEYQAERRQLTVMFVDLVGSTMLSGQLDPEDLSVLMRRYQNTVAGEINRLEGFVARFMGDGVLAYFGWPQAREDSAERAIRAALAIVAEVGQLRTPDEQALAARVGIATGQVVVGELIGEGSAQEEAVVGKTPNIAARLEALAKPGCVLISDSTRQLCGEVFEFESLGAQSLKGVAEAVTVYRVGRERILESRFQAHQTGAVLPLIGRESELAQIMTHWQQARSGEGQMMLLTGEAGIGKSRLIRAVTEALKAEAHYPISYQCSPYHSDSALYPVIQQLVRTAGFAAEDTNKTKLDKLETLLKSQVKAGGHRRTYCHFVESRYCRTLWSS